MGRDTACGVGAASYRARQRAKVRLHAGSDAFANDRLIDNFKKVRIT